MTRPQVIVVGGGAAGMAAAIAVKEAGLSVLLMEQGAATGGAIHRQPVHPARASAAPGPWQVLASRAESLSLPIQTSSVFLGVEGNGAILIDNRAKGAVEIHHARALITATGAVEKVHPRMGWHLSGVASVGGLQVMMKETGRPPQGRVLLAGNGPLLTIAAAQLCLAGNPPVAVVEAGNPIARGSAAIKLLARGDIISEAMRSLFVLTRYKVRWLRGHSLESIEKRGTQLAATVRSHTGQEHVIEVDRIGLHDGIRPNDFGLPPETLDPGALVVARAGDCREALGASVAEIDGRRAAHKVIAALGGNAASLAQAELEIDAGRRLQHTLAALFAPVDKASPFDRLPDETVLCRCEGQTVGDLRRLYDREDALSAREVKLVGRFGMGSCQGRFCAVNTAALMAHIRPDLPPSGPKDLTGHRWPIRPVSIGAVTRAQEDTL